MTRENAAAEEGRARLIHTHTYTQTKTHKHEGNTGLSSVKRKSKEAAEFQRHM